MSNNKCICPECGSQLEYWKEYLVVKTQLINPNTGLLDKKVSKSNLDENNGDMQGFKCTKCNWCLNVVNQSIPDNLNEWYDKNVYKIKV